MSDVRPKVLIVEDDDALAYATSRYLEKEGYDTIVSLSSMEAFKELEKNKVDAVITDIRFPRGEPHGLALGRMIQDKFPEIPIIFITAYPELLDGEPALPGIVLRKPVELEAISGTLKSCLSN